MLQNFSKIKSWKTTSGGIGLILTSLGTVLTAFYQDQAIDWNIVIIGILGGLSLLGAKDVDVKDEL